MDNRMKEVVRILKEIGKVSVETVAGILKEISIEGVIAATIMEFPIKIDDRLSNMRDSDTISTINRKCDAILKAVENKEISINQLREKLEKGIVESVKKLDDKKQIYMSGIILYTYEEAALDYDNIQFVKDILTSTDGDENQNIKYIETIRNFLEYYNESSVVSNEEDDNFFVNKNMLIINFIDNGVKKLRNEEDVIQFADALNNLTNGYMPKFREYIIF